MTTRMVRSSIVAGGATVLAVFLVGLTTLGADGPAKNEAQIRVGDRLFLQVGDVLPNQPIKGVYRVEYSGKLPLGYSYGRVEVAGLTPEAAETRIRDQLKAIVKNPVVSLTWYDPVAHGAPGLTERVTKLEKEVTELRGLVDKLRKQ